MGTHQNHDFTRNKISSRSLVKRCLAWCRRHFGPDIRRQGTNPSISAPILHNSTTQPQEPSTQPGPKTHSSKLAGPEEALGSHPVASTRPKASQIDTPLALVEEGRATASSAYSTSPVPSILVTTPTGSTEEPKELTSRDRIKKTVDPAPLSPDHLIPELAPAGGWRLAFQRQGHALRRQRGDLLLQSQETESLIRVLQALESDFGEPWVSGQKFSLEYRLLRLVELMSRHHLQQAQQMARRHRHELESYRELLICEMKSKAKVERELARQTRVIAAMIPTTTIGGS